MKTIETLTGAANGAGVFDETAHMSNAVLWEHPDYPGYFVPSVFGPAGLKLYTSAGVKVAYKFADLFSLAIAQEPNLLPVLPTPTATPGSGAHPQSVSLACLLNGVAVAGVEIRYTTDGSAPTGASTLYTVPINVAAALTLKAKAFKTPYWNPSAIGSFIYT